MRVNEIFYSLQGEGRWAGTPAIFIRLAGCNLHCNFCDTNHQPFTEMADREIIAAIAEFPAHHVVITGGEPTLQLTCAFLKKLHTKGYFIQIETNGTTRLPYGAIHFVDWITCSPKTDDMPIIQRIDEVKVVYEEGYDVSSKLNIPLTYSGCRYLQPCDRHNAETNAANLRATIEYIKTHPQWKLSLQTQKILDVR